MMKEIVTELVKKSKIYKDFKEEILYSLDNGREIIIHLDNCLDFLKKKGYKTWNITDEEDQKLENHLKVYISEKLPNFPYEIMTEDYVTIYEPGARYNFTQDELPKKYVWKKKDIFEFRGAFLDKRPQIKNTYVGDLNNNIGSVCLFSKYLPEKTCLHLKELFDNDDLSQILLEYDKFLQKHPNFGTKILKLVIDNRDSFEKVKSKVTRVHPQDYER